MTLHDFMKCKLGRRIGRGANSTIYLALEVAPELIKEGDDRQRVAKIISANDEATALCNYHKSAVVRDLPSHPNIISYDCVQLGAPDDNDVLALMPRYAGDLGAYVARRREPGAGIATETALHIGEQLAAALAHLHACGKWHLDVSYANVLVSDLASVVPSVVLTDLEHSRLSDDEPPAADYTADFASPERGDLDRCGAKSDVFSLGVLLYALATGSEYPGIVDGVPGLGAGFLSRREMTPARVAAVVHRDLPQAPHLASLITLALNHDPKTRMSMASFHDAIGRLRHGGEMAFPDALPPLHVKLVSDNARHKVVVNNSSGIFDVNVACCNCGRSRHVSMKQRTDCLGDAMHLPGNLCPGSRRGPKALSPADGELPPYLSFRYLYPMVPEGAMSDSVVAVADQRRSLNALQLHGGFAVTEVREGFIAPKILLVVEAPDEPVEGPEPSTKVAFSAPQPWPGECTQVLQRDGRIHSPIPALLGTTTATSFAWIMPGETFKLSNGETWEASPEGGFVFFFNESPMDPHELDRFFAIAVETQSSIQNAGGALAGTLSGMAHNVAEFSRQMGGLFQEVARAMFPVGGAGSRVAVRPPDSSASTNDTASTAEGQMSASGAQSGSPGSEVGDGDAAATAAQQTTRVSAPTTRPLPIALWIIEVPLCSVELLGEKRWRCPEGGIEGEIGTRRKVSRQIAAAFDLPPTAAAVALLRVESRNGDSALFKHHGLVAYEGDRCVCIKAFTITTTTCAVAPNGHQQQLAAGTKVKALLPPEDHIDPEYRGDDAPLRVDGVEHVSMFGLHVHDDGKGAEVFYGSSAMDAWHVRRIIPVSR